MIYFEMDRKSPTKTFYDGKLRTRFMYVIQFKVRNK